tara:strand:- start:538 stop:1416 length:879 start_codon:yes stop_codon:yes gene_type:complete
MTSTHIEHPEDLILTGDLSVIDALFAPADITMKMDGMSLVWGTNPDNGKFFVCTKAAFNKKKIRLCYTIDDILTHFGHQIEVVDILSHCLKYLPRTENIYWGDWLGFGRTNTLNPNTITYVFPEHIPQKMVIAPHTVVNVQEEMWSAVCQPLTEIFDDTAIIKWVQPSIDRLPSKQSAPKLDTSKVQFMTTKEANVAKQRINTLIKEGRELTDSNLFDILGCVYLTNLYQMIIEIKDDIMESMIINDAPRSFIFEDVETDGEGYVFHTEFGSFKLVNREEFAYANFTDGRFN